MVKPTQMDWFWSKVDKSGPGGCWLWQGAKSSVDWGDRVGYGTVTINKKSAKVHRFVYELLVGPIPEGLVIDHLCRVTLCCNPDHLEPVTVRENILRGESPGAIAVRRDVCFNGHPYTPETVFVVTSPRGQQRKCRLCRREVSRRYEARRKARGAA